MILSRPFKHLAYLKQVCLDLEIPFEVKDKHGNLIMVQSGGPNGRRHYFANFATPFNDASVVKICADKEFTYHLLQDQIAMPRTVGFLDPDLNRRFAAYRSHNDRTQIIKAIEAEFAYPLVVKMNQGLQGKNVFLCRNSSALTKALAQIYNKRSPAYDYVALAQTYIKRQAEYRLLTFRGRLIFAYEKNTAEAAFAGNLSPLHYLNAKANLVVDEQLLAELADFVQPLFAVLDFQFGGIDVLVDPTGQKYLLELNTNPGFDLFLRDNDPAPLIRMYEDLLKALGP